MRRTSIFVGDEDRAAIRTIRQRYGVSTDSDAIRLALRVLAEAKEIEISPLPKSVSRPEDEEDVLGGMEANHGQAARTQ